MRTLRGHWVDSPQAPHVNRKRPLVNKEQELPYAPRQTLVVRPFNLIVVAIRRHPHELEFAQHRRAGHEGCSS
jgi:hypothetical protein